VGVFEDHTELGVVGQILEQGIGESTLAAIQEPQAERHFRKAGGTGGRYRLASRRLIGSHGVLAGEVRGRRSGLRP
jgi:hypothetical protein